MKTHRDPSKLKRKYTKTFEFGDFRRLNLLILGPELYQKLNSFL